jgi:hypothetical protein
MYGGRIAASRLFLHSLNSCVSLLEALIKLPDRIALYVE